MKLLLKLFLNWAEAETEPPSVSLLIHTNDKELTTSQGSPFHGRKVVTTRKLCVKGWNRYSPKNRDQSCLCLGILKLSSTWQPLRCLKYLWFPNFIFSVSHLDGAILLFSSAELLQLSTMLPNLKSQTNPVFKLSLRKMGFFTPNLWKPQE